MDNNSGNRFKGAYEFISSLNKEAFKEIFLISNQVLSKDPFSSDFLRFYVNDEKPVRRGSSTIISKLLVYYFKSLGHFMLYIFKFIEFGLIGYRFYPAKDKKELTLIDTFFMPEKIINAQGFNELYLPGLEDVLNKLGRHYAYLPHFSGPSNNKTAFELYKALKILKRRKIPILCEFQLLTLSDMLYILYFILVYPFSVLRFLNKCGCGEYKIDLIRSEMIAGLNQVTFHNFSRYLQGKRIAKLAYEKIKVISWYENLPIHKNLYKGLRINYTKVKIYGAQLLLVSEDCLFTKPDENEQRFGLLPDKILVNGQFYIPEKTSLNYAIGPSLRYARVFNTVIKKEKRKNILVLFPYFDEDIKGLLSILSKLPGDLNNIVIKLHPATSLNKYQNLIPLWARVEDKDTYMLLEETKIVIGSASGTLIESIALGIPAIVVKNSVHSPYSNPLPDYGRGVIWDEARNPQELFLRIAEFEKRLDENVRELGNIAQNYRSMFFCQPSEERIIEAFDL